MIVSRSLYNLYVDFSKKFLKDVVLILTENFQFIFDLSF